MSDLETYTAFAEIFGVLTILGGAAFAMVQYAEYRKRRRNQVAADLCRAFAEPELAKAVALVKKLPDHVTMAEMKQRGDDYDAAAQVVGMAFETMGLMVHRDVASFSMIQELTGGLLLMMWRKIDVWVGETREAQDNPRFGEWVQWLAERVQAHESKMVPAYDAYKDWQPRN